MHKIIKSIDQFNRFFRQPTSHPLVSVGNLSYADFSLFEPTDFGMYCVVLMDNEFGELVLRNTRMRYRAGTMFTMKPGDVVSMNLDAHAKPHGWMLAFSPELLNGTGLGRDFYMFNFFDFEVAEALELYDSERRVIINCYNNILAELLAPDDKFTGHMLRLGIAQLLTFCQRYYERQFDTRQMQKSELLQRLDQLLDDYLSVGSSLPRELGYPTVGWCASQFHLTPSYFGDIVRRELGLTAQEYIHRLLIDRSKALLVQGNHSVNDVADLLGFRYSNHFSRFFRSREGITPSEFKRKVPHRPSQGRE